MDAPLRDILDERCRYPLLDAALTFPGLGTYTCLAMVDTGCGDVCGGPDLAKWLIEQQAVRGDLRPRPNQPWDEALEIWENALYGSKLTANITLGSHTNHIALLDTDFFLIKRDLGGVKMLIGQVHGLHRLRFVQDRDREMSLTVP